MEVISMLIWLAATLVLYYLIRKKTWGWLAKWIVEVGGGFLIALVVVVVLTMAPLWLR